MKKITHLSFIVALLFCTSIVCAQTYKTINVITAGTLSSLLTSDEKTNVTQLTVTGTIDARDVKCMRDELIALSIIDMGSATLVAYSGSLGTYPGSIRYGSNELPLSSFLLQPNTPKATLTSILLPTNLTSISSYVFAMCTNLKSSIIIPASVTSISNYAFMGSTGLTKISVLAATPPSVSSSTFLGMNQSSCTLEVPTGTKALYMANSVWSSFNPIIEKSFTTNESELIKPNYKVSSYKSNIIIKGTKIGDKISLITMNGILLKSISSDGEDQTITCEKAKTYIVRINDSNFKVQL